MSAVAAVQLFGTPSTKLLKKPSVSNRQVVSWQEIRFTKLFVVFIEVGCAEGHEYFLDSRFSPAKGFLSTEALDWDTQHQVPDFWMAIDI